MSFNKDNMETFEEKVSIYCIRPLHVTNSESESRSRGGPAIEGQRSLP
jgi:hypothetical protein